MIDFIQTAIFLSAIFIAGIYFGVEYTKKKVEELQEKLQKSSLQELHLLIDLEEKIEQAIIMEKQLAEAREVAKKSTSTVEETNG